MRCIDELDKTVNEKEWPAIIEKYLEDIDDIDENILDHYQLVYRYLLNINCTAKCPIISNDKYINNKQGVKVIDPIEAALSTEPVTNIREGKRYIVKDGATFAIMKTVKRRFARHFYYYDMPDINYVAEIEKLIRPEVVEKLKIKLLNMDKITKDDMKKLLLYINREEPLLNITSDAPNLLATIIKEIAETEKKLFVLENSELVQVANDFKNKDSGIEINTKLNNTIFEKICNWAKQLFVSVDDLQNEVPEDSLKPHIINSYKRKPLNPFDSYYHF